jgi:3-hydroxyacyl-CoA dehydrogenase
MGAGIATALVNAGIPVRMRDVEQEALERGIAIVHKNLERSVEKGRSTRAEADRKLAMVQPQSSYEGFDKVHLVIEAVFEDMALKKQVFAEIDSVARSGCVLGSNTSTLDIDALAAETSRPESVVGLHFFSPAHVMRLLEIVRAARTSKSVLATALSLARTLRKVGVVVGNCRGFVGNRMMLPCMREAQFLVEEGATPTAVDRALYDFGMAMGIFAVDDMGGLDVQWRVRRESRGLEKPGARGPLVLDKLYAMGRLGQKTGSGWYRYEGGGRTPYPDPEVEALIEATAREAGIRRRPIGPEEIIERCIYVMINEAARILDEGHALRAGDIDTIYLTGYGFPGYRGGPMWYADTVGLDRVHARIEACRDVHGEAWEPAPLLTRLVAEGRSFADYDAARTGSP